MSAILTEHSQGLLKDGRRFEIIDFKNLVVAEDGSIHSGLVGVVIDDRYFPTSLSMLAENIDYENYNRQ